MDPLFTDTGMQMHGLANQGGKSQFEAKAKSMGVPNEIVAQGQGAIKAWAEENGKIPGAVKEAGGGAENRMNNSENETLMKQLESAGITYDSYTQAVEKGPEATEALLSENNFSFDVKA